MNQMIRWLAAAMTAAILTAGLAVNAYAQADEATPLPGWEWVPQEWTGYSLGPDEQTISSVWSNLDSRKHIEYTTELEGRGLASEFRSDSQSFRLWRCVHPETGQIIDDKGLLPAPPSEPCGYWLRPPGPSQTFNVVGADAPDGADWCVFGTYPNGDAGVICRGDLRPGGGYGDFYTYAEARAVFGLDTA